MNRNEDRRCIPERTVRHIRHDRACGISLAKVAKIYGVTITTVRRLCDETVFAHVRDYMRVAAKKVSGKPIEEQADEQTEEQIEERRRRHREAMRRYREHIKQIGDKKCKKK